MSARATEEHQNIERISVSLLIAGDSPRLRGEDEEHIRVLAGADAAMPPILVQRGTMRVIDGMHRLRAALLKGDDTIDVGFFEGSDDEAFVAAVQANMAHGLPLTMADRQAAAERILSSHPLRSNRWIAAVTGLAAGTVASIRRRIEAGDDRVKERIGRDGRLRPLNTASGRMIARDALTAHPEASLREIAKIAGISTGTVRDVRDRLRRGEDPVPERQTRAQRRRLAAVGSPGQETGPRGASPRPERSRASLLQALRKDPSLRLTESGRALLRWLDARAAGPGQWADVLVAAPPHCSYIVAQLARLCADEWLEVAAQLEEELRTMPSASGDEEMRAFGHLAF
jgi:DNA-binding CsgD family transcriptional regulator